MAALLLAAAACSQGGGPGAPAPGGAALAYAVPTGSALVYEIGDTSVVNMDIMGNAMQIVARSASTVELALAAAGSGLNGTLTFRAVAGEVTNPMGPPVTISPGDMPGPTSLAVTPRGAITITARPEMSTIMTQVFGSESYVQRMFIRVPGRAVQPGATWTDTVSTSEQAAGMNQSGTSIVTSTLRGDTVVAGTRLLIIDSKTVATQQVSGSNEGVEVRQSLAGTTTAVTLWDPARGAIVERKETGTLTGSMELPAMGMSGLPVNVSQTQVLRLRR